MISPRQSHRVRLLRRQPGREAYEFLRPPVKRLVQVPRAVTGFVALLRGHRRSTWRTSCSASMAPAPVPAAPAALVRVAMGISNRAEKDTQKHRYASLPPLGSAHHRPRRLRHKLRDTSGVLLVRRHRLLHRADPRLQHFHLRQLRPAGGRHARQRGEDQVSDLPVRGVGGGSKQRPTGLSGAVAPAHAASLEFRHQATIDAVAARGGDKDKATKQKPPSPACGRRERSDSENDEAPRSSGARRRPDSRAHPSTPRTAHARGLGSHSAHSASGAFSIPMDAISALS